MTLLILRLSMAIGLLYTGFLLVYDPDVIITRQLTVTIWGWAFLVWAVSQLIALYPPFRFTAAKVGATWFFWRQWMSSRVLDAMMHAYVGKIHANTIQFIRDQFEASTADDTSNTPGMEEFLEHLADEGKGQTVVEFSQLEDMLKRVGEVISDVEDSDDDDDDDDSTELSTGQYL